MFTLASQKFFGRRILVIEQDDAIVESMRAAIAGAGGTALGPMNDIDEALFYIATVGRVDCVLIETSVTASTSRPIPELFRDRGVETIFVIGHDDWFDEDEDDWSVEGGGSSALLACA